MKTSKLVLIATIFAFGIVSVVSADGFKTPPAKKVINLTLEQALQDAGLVAAMYQQIDSEFLGQSQGEQLYVASVDYMNYTVRISGTYEEWALFFRIRIVESEREPLVRTR